MELDNQLLEPLRTYVGNTNIKNAHIIQPDGSAMGNLSIVDGYIAFIHDQPFDDATAIDFEGDYLIPGLVDLHTDNIEQHFSPRPGVEWPSPLSAVLAHDSKMVTAGVTTVFDSLSIGDYKSGGIRPRLLKFAIDAISKATAHNILVADHYFHFRCEVSDPFLADIVVEYLDHDLLRLFSVMDHTPGQRQWQDLDFYRKYRREKQGIIWEDDAAFEAYLVKCREQQTTFVPKHRKLINEAAIMRQIPLASHDDTSIEDVEQSASEGVTISEFPTSIEAARKARELGLQIVMGAPNIVLGGSHSGNVSAADLTDEGLLDILTSDYVAASLLQAPFILAERGMALHEAIALVTLNPAKAIGLTDRGQIAQGARADLLRVRLIDNVPVIRGIWLAGKQVFNYK